MKAGRELTTPTVSPRDFNPDTHTQELFVTQKAFRAVMDAMARPGALRELPAMYLPTLDNPFLESITVMLLDSRTRFSVEGPSSVAMQDAISARCYAVPASLEEADFALITAEADTAAATQALLSLKGGSALSPELGATAIITCRSLTDGDTQVKVSGPGVESEHRFTLAGQDSWWIEARAARGDGVPVGIDLLLVDEQGKVVALPRTAVIERSVISEGEVL